MLLTARPIANVLTVLFSDSDAVSLSGMLTQPGQFSNKFGYTAGLTTFSFVQYCINVITLALVNCLLRILEAASIVRKNLLSIPSGLVFCVDVHARNVVLHCYTCNNARSMLPYYEVVIHKQVMPGAYFAP